MKLTVKVIPRSSRSELVPDKENLKAYLHSAPDKGKANKELVELVACRYNVPKSRVVILSGETSRNKILEVLGL
ncbi:MAG: DUF167 domain-containing protein [Candidatus Omnitrophica bacterium]|nr:DUF167 domain-containing protein [Candidatus Omnitrophota bacterium]